MTQEQPPILNQTGPVYPQQTDPNGSAPKNKSIWLFILVVIGIALIAGGCVYFYILKSTTNVATKTDNSPSPDTTSQSSDKLVLRNEVGCSGNNLFVLSTVSGQVPVDAVGNYKAEFSKEGAQLVFLTNGENKVCASATSLPEYNGKVNFDAKSTAETLVFQTIGILSTDPNEAKERLVMIEQLPSFSDLNSYIKTNLPKQDMASLQADPNFDNLLQKCIKEAAQKLGKPF